MVNMQAFVKELNLTVLSGSSGESWDLSSPEINRPGLELIGFYEHFAHERPQVMGNVEISYLDSLAPEDRKARLEKYFSFPIPVVIICRGLQPHKELLETARERDVPILQSQDSTTAFIVDAILYLSKILAPRTTRHAVLVDVYGTGILITGESGVGKSESALELIKRGHQLVADDTVDIRRVSKERLTGEAPETIRHCMEIRGIGIIDIRAMYGVGSVIISKSIDMVIHMEKWDQTKEYDRLGLTEETVTILGVKVPYQIMPVRPGRNLAIIIEVASRNLSLKRLGYSAAHELDRRLNEMIAQNRSAEE